MQNPYEPPQAHVADAADIVRGPRPQAVRRAVMAFWIGWTLGLLTLIPGVRENVWDNPEIPAGVTLAVAIVFGAFSAWLIVMVGRGRNWARWAWLVYIAVTYVLMASDPSGWERQGPVALAADMMSLVLDGYGCYLIFSGEGARWFSGGAAGLSS